MTPTAIIAKAAEDGVSLTLTPAGTVKAAGDPGTVARWLPIIRENKPAIVACLNRAETQAANSAFAFSPPSDLANDAEAVYERAAIIGEANGWDAARALQEARWQADKERAWRAFLRNAERVLEAPEGHRGGMLDIYHSEAVALYGEEIGGSMGRTMRQWVESRCRAIH